MRTRFDHRGFKSGRTKSNAATAARSTPKVYQGFTCKAPKQPQLVSPVQPRKKFPAPNITKVSRLISQAPVGPLPERSQTPRKTSKAITRKWKPGADKTLARPTNS